MQTGGSAESHHQVLYQWNKYNKVSQTCVQEKRPLNFSLHSNKKSKIVIKGKCAIQRELIIFFFPKL